MADVFTKLPGAPFWSLLFFSMLLSLGLGSQIGILEGMIGPLFDVPFLKKVKKPLITGKKFYSQFDQLRLIRLQAKQMASLEFSLG